MTPRKPRTGLLKFFSENLNTLKGLGWLLTALIGAFAWWGEHSKNSGSISRDDLRMELKMSRDTTLQMSGMYTDSVVGDFRFRLNKQLSDYANEYLEPMLQTDEELRIQVVSNDRLLREVAVAQRAIGHDFKKKMDVEAEKDSLAKENARLRSQIRIREAVDQLINQTGGGGSGGTTGGQYPPPAKKQPFKDKVE